MITRGEVVGKPWKYNGPANIYVTIRTLSKEPVNPVKIIFYPENRYPIIRYSPAIKSLNYIGNMLAKKDADEADAYEPIFFNNNKLVIHINTTIKSAHLR